MKRTGLLGALAAGSLLIALIIFFCWKLVFTNLILVGVDSFLYFYPYRAFVTKALLEGHFPLWNPHLFLGAPLFANMQTAVLYPLHWPLLWLSVPKQVAVSIMLHVVLAGIGMLTFTRRALRLCWAGALTSAVIFGLGGFVGGQAEHINQLNCITWLPWAFLLLDGAMTAGGQPVSISERALRGLGLTLVITLMILAGHAQSVYICLVGLGLYALLRPAFASPALKGWTGFIHYARRYSLAGLVVLVLATGLAMLLTAVQLLPTWELSRLSVRSGGLTYREATSFSLNPWLLHYTLLPPYGVDLSHVFGEAYSEYVAYIGLIGLGLALSGLWYGWRRPQRGSMQPAARFFTVLALVGLFLALGRVNPIYYVLHNLVPGFDTFRVPARWMLLYTLGAAVLAGIGLDRVAQLIRHSSDSQPAGRWYLRIARWATTVLVVILCGELFVASRALRYSQPTAPEAFTSLRPSIAHLNTDPGLHRFLSLSGIVYDPGDLAEMRAMFAGQLPEQAIYDYVVAAKEKEVLFYNLPLLYGFYSVDGYDGGLLPLRSFVTMQRLFLAKDQLSIDGRLRENLRDVPSGRLLSLLGVKYIITDKVYDVWIDGIFYDLQFPAQLSRNHVSIVDATVLPDFPTTDLGIVSYLEGMTEIGQDTPVARVSVVDNTGWSQTLELLAGRDTSEGRYGQGVVAHQQARIGHTWRDDPTGNDYITVIPLDGPHRLTRISVEAIAPAGRCVLRGLSLVDMRTRSSQQLTLSTEGQYRLVHSGDVKIYQNLGVLPRAFVAHHAEVAPDDEAVIARLRDPAFDPAKTIILAEGEPLSGSGTGQAEITRYVPEEVAIQVFSDASGYLVLTDTFYPGWEATVDGQPAPILRADLVFRAVPLMPGSHRVELHYRPASVRLGMWVSVVAATIWLGGLVWCLRRRCCANAIRCR